LFNSIKHDELSAEMYYLFMLLVSDIFNNSTEVKKIKENQ
jgi:hypothetical protein